MREKRKYCARKRSYNNKERCRRKSARDERENLWRGRLRWNVIESESKRGFDRLRWIKRDESKTIETR